MNKPQDDTKPAAVQNREMKRTMSITPSFTDQATREMKDEPDYSAPLAGISELRKKRSDVLDSLHWMEMGNGFVFQGLQSHFEKKPVDIQGEPTYAKDKVKLSEDLNVSGTVPHIPDKLKMDPKYTIGVDFNSKGEPISRLPIAMGGIPYGGVDVRIDEVSMPHYGTYTEYDMGAYYNENLAKGDMLR